MIPDLLRNHGMQLVDGFGVTLELVAISIVIGALLAIPLTAARLSQNRIIGALAYSYVYFFRGTPLLAQLFLIYYGAGQFAGALKAVGLWHFFRDAFNCAALAFAVNTAAYQAEIYRGAIRSVPQGQWEAADTLGLHRTVTLWKIVLPQAAIVALRPLGNEIILMVKASAVASIVTVYDLMGETKLAFSRSYDLTIYLYAAVLYLILVEAIRRIWNIFDARLTRHLQRESRPAPTKAADLAPATR
jgi:polar amino acid transport system permease protein